MVQLQTFIGEALEGVRESTEATTRAVKFVEGRADKRETGPGEDEGGGRGERRDAVGVSVRVRVRVRVQSQRQS